MGQPWPGQQGHPTPPGAPAGDGPRRKLSTAMVVALVAAVVVAIAGLSWGAWATFRDTGDPQAGKNGKPTPTAPTSSAPPSPTGPVYPYGEEVGLKKPLQAGDCVNVVWSGTPFKSGANLGVVACGAEDSLADGQVLALETHASAQEAGDQGAERCAGQVGPIAEALPDAGVHAVVPTKEGFEAAGRATACLVLGEHAAIGGEIGRFRDDGQMLFTNQMSVGDCLRYDDSVKDAEGYRLTDCAEQHELQVIPGAAAPGGMSWTKVSEEAWKVCGNKYESAWAPGGDHAVFGFAPYEEDWKDGMKTLVCLVGRTDGTAFTGAIADPAEA
uniref:septum formation family protein n=1 Tax=Streptomyces polyasparticus TaxID=2767826 RepID=UPI00280AD871|nr:septum formation family protein [Streptomyces polyasparticus]